MQSLAKIVPLDFQNATFEQWRNRINKNLTMKMGMGIDDLPDYDWMGLYEDGVNTKEATREYLDGIREDMGY